jgi:aspartate aminotransferase
MAFKGFSFRVMEVDQSKSIEIADKIRRLKTKGIDIIELQTGEPDFNTPQHIVDAAYDAMKKGYTHYTSSRGLPELREKVSEKLKKENKIDANPERDILITAGAVHAVFSAIMATVNPGDEVILFDPCWVAYPACVKLAGAIPVMIPLRGEDNSDVYAESIERQISPKTKMMILNYPCNPTGHTLTRDSLQHIADIAQEHDLLVMADEIYEKILYDSVTHHSMGCLDDMNGRTITVNGFSKTYAMTGWRIGYVCAGSEIINQMLKIQQYSVSCVSAFVQKAALSALNGPQDSVRNMVREYGQRRELIIDRLNRINGICCRKPMGTFYAFANIAELGMSSMEVAALLLDEAGIGVVPGSAYGQSGEGFIRLSFANSRENIEKAMNRMEKLLGTKEV